jgi:hypothetical protein
MEINMLRTTQPMKQVIPGIFSPFLCARCPTALKQVVDSGSQNDRNMAMRELAQRHLIDSQQKVCFDRIAYLKHMTSFINERKTDRELFVEFLANASQDQIQHALKVAFSNNDLNSMKIILSYAKNPQKTLDELFIQLSSKKDVSLEIIREILPLCSEQVVSRYLKQMIIQKNKNAVREIIAFYKPTEEHKLLARIHFSSASLSIFRGLTSAARNQFLGIQGLVNTSFVQQLVSDAKEQGKQIVVTAREAAKLALRRMGLLAGPTDLVIREEKNSLENLNGLAYGRDDSSYYYDEESLQLNAGSPLLKGAGLSIAQSMKNAMLESSLVSRLEEKVKIALPSGPSFTVDELDEESSDSYTIPQVNTNFSEENTSGFGRNTVRGVAFAGALAAGMAHSTSEEEAPVQQLAEPSSKTEETAKDEDVKTKEENQSESKMIARDSDKSNSLEQGEAPVQQQHAEPSSKTEETAEAKDVKTKEESQPKIRMIARDLDKGNSLERSHKDSSKQIKPVVKEFSDEYILRPSWEDILNQMKKDDLNGGTFRNHILGYTP